MAKQAQIEEVRPMLDHLDSGADIIEKALKKVDKGADKATDVLETGLETVADVVPETLDTVVHVATGGTRRLAGAFRSPKVVALTIVLIGAGAGAGLGVIGYKLAQKKLQKQFDERLEVEIEQMRAFFERKTKTGSYSTPGEAAEALHVKAAVEAMDEYATPPGREYSERPTRAPRAEARTDEDEGAAAAEEDDGPSNIFTAGAPVGNFDLEREMALRDAQPDMPYVISFEEYMEGKGYSQTHMTYYEGDDVLTDENDIPIEEVEATVGNDNLSRFGHGSKDVNLVYVRNDRVELDIEIARSTGKFSEEVSGFIEHSEIRRGRDARGRFRRGEDE